MILISELTVCSRVLEGLYKPEKINIGALGNLVPQLHIHVVARFETNAAWPGPVWGFGERQPHSTSVLEDTVTSLRKLLRNELAKETQQNNLPRQN